MNQKMQAADTITAVAMQVRFGERRQNKPLTGPSNTLNPYATSVLSRQSSAGGTPLPARTCGSYLCDRPLDLTLLLLCNLHKKGVQGKVSLTVLHVTLICYSMSALSLSSYHFHRRECIFKRKQSHDYQEPGQLHIDTMGTLSALSYTS